MQLAVRQQAVDDLSDALQEVGQVFGKMRRFGQGEGSGLAFLAAFAGGDVAGNGDAYLMRFGPAGRPHDVDDLPVLAHIAILKAGQRGAGHDLARRLQGTRTIFLQHQLDHRAAYQLVGTIAEQLFAGCTQRHEATMRVYHANGIQQEVHDRVVEYESAALHDGELPNYCCGVQETA